MIKISPAAAADSAVIREWLPELGAARPQAQVFIARHCETGQAVGAAALAWGMQRFRILLRVREVQHEREIRARLLEAVLDAARRQGAEAVYAWQGVAADSPALAAWNALGFIVAEGVIVYEVDLRAFLADLEPLYQRLRQRGKIPSRARLVGLREAPLAEAARLRLQTLGGQPRRLAARLWGQAGPENFCPLLSRVLLLNDRVTGVCLLSRLEPELALVDSVAVTPGLRGGWANVLLKYATADNVLAQGVTRIRFRAATQHTDTHRHAARVQAQVVARIVLPYHPL